MPASSQRPTCPSCGIAVTPGYRRCPKCHAALPSSVQMSRLDTAGGGGGATTTAPLDEPGARWPWYLAGLVVLGGAVAVIVHGSRDERPAAPLPDDPIIDEAEAAPDEPPADDEVAPAPRVGTPDPGPAADRLARLMAGVRLYATVEADGELLEIRSSFCDDDRISALLADVAPDLRAAGVADVRCRALGGPEAWTRPLP